jgi:hypothetical protein
LGKSIHIRTYKSNFGSSYIPTKIGEAGFPLEADIAAAAASAELAARELDSQPPEMNNFEIPLGSSCIAHVQFETIHPFADGNGWIGRALILALLRRRGVVGRRNRTWECVGLFDLLDRFKGDLGPAGRTPSPTH